MTVVETPPRQLAARCLPRLSRTGRRAWHDPSVSRSTLDRARDGDEHAFRELTAPYLHELRLHCYRMLGSVVDAEDLLQETLLAAWRGLDGFAGRSSLRAWLYRIATNRCLNAIRDTLRRRPAQPIAPFDPPPPSRRGEVTWLQPYPDLWLEQAADQAPGPAARSEARETVGVPCNALAHHSINPARRLAGPLEEATQLRSGSWRGASRWRSPPTTSMVSSTCSPTMHGSPCRQHRTNTMAPKPSRPSCGPARTGARRAPYPAGACRGQHAARLRLLPRRLHRADRVPHRHPGPHPVRWLNQSHHPLPRRRPAPPLRTRRRASLQRQPDPGEVWWLTLWLVMVAPRQTGPDWRGRCSCRVVEPVRNEASSDCNRARADLVAARPNVAK